MRWVPAAKSVRLSRVLAEAAWLLRVATLLLAATCHQLRAGVTAADDPTSSDSWGRALLQEQWTTARENLKGQGRPTPQSGVGWESLRAVCADGSAAADDCSLLAVCASAADPPYLRLALSAVSVPTTISVFVGAGASHRQSAGLQIYAGPGGGGYAGSALCATLPIAVRPFDVFTFSVDGSLGTRFLPDCVGAPAGYIYFVAAAADGVACADARAAFLGEVAQVQVWGADLPTPPPHTTTPTPTYPPTPAAPDITPQAPGSPAAPRPGALPLLEAPTPSPALSEAQRRWNDWTCYLAHYPRVRERFCADYANMVSSPLARPGPMRAHGALHSALRGGGHHMGGMVGVAVEACDLPGVIADYQRHSQQYRSKDCALGLILAAVFTAGFAGDGVSEEEAQQVAAVYASAAGLEPAAVRVSDAAVELVGNMVLEITIEQLQASRAGIVAAMADAAGVDMPDFTLRDASVSTFRGRRRLQQARYLDLTYAVNVPGGENLAGVQAALADRERFRAAFAAAGGLLPPDALLRLKDMETRALLQLDVFLGPGDNETSVRAALLAVRSQAFAGVGMDALLAESSLRQRPAVQWHSGAPAATPAPVGSGGRTMAVGAYEDASAGGAGWALSVPAIAGIFIGSVVTVLVLLGSVLVWRLHRQGADLAVMLGSKAPESKFPGSPRSSLDVEVLRDAAESAPPAPRNGAVPSKAHSARRDSLCVERRDSLCVESFSSPGLVPGPVGK
eukprot:jgi/Tetstr1/427058/TSEL_017263.t1